MGKASRYKRDGRVSTAAVLRAHDHGELVCSNCGWLVSPNEMSFSTELGGEVVVSCYQCAPGLMQVLDQVYESGRRFRDGWLSHCAGGVNCFEGYTMRDLGSSS
jgi:hypothetical protein